MARILRMYDDWSGRSVFVVGDADQSIYSFRAADFTILMGFQDDFGDQAPDDATRTMVKLEDNYRSTATILEAANALISNNSERIDKVLRPTRGEGELISLTRCDDEIAEAEAVVHRLRTMEAANPELSWGDMAVLYRTNAQSRAIEESLVRWGIPYIVVGGLRFYDRREIKDLLAYLRLLINPADTVSLLRVINVPKRGIGKTTIQRLTDAANQLGIPLWDVVSDPEAVRSLGGRSAKGLLQFCDLVNDLQSRSRELAPSELIQQVMEKSGYVSELIADGTDEAEERRRNLQELVNAALQYQEENEEGDLEGFLASAALASDADSKDTAADRVTLMTLHSSKGWSSLWSAWWAWSRVCSPVIAHLTIRHHWRRNDVFATSASPGRKSVCSSPMPVSGVFGVGCARQRFRRCFFRSCRRPWCRGIFPRVVEQRFGASGAWNGSPVWIATNRHRLLRMRCGDVRQGQPPVGVGRWVIR